MKLIHCADIHLDSALGTHLPPDKAAARRSEMLQTFAAMAAYAKENEVRAVIIAGDLFDVSRVTRKAAAFVLDTVRNYPQIDFYLLRGNHDGGHQAFEGMNLPENLHLFSSEFKVFSLENVRIGGAEDLSAPDLYNTVDFPKEPFNVAVFHGAQGTSAGEDQVCLPRLQNKNIDYLALGHYHTYTCKKLDQRGIWAYSGCLEGRGFDECGSKGMIVLDTDRRSVQFVSLARRTLHEVEADITGCVTTREVEAAVLSAVDNLPAEDLVRVILTGHYEVETEKDLSYLTQQLRSRFYFAEVYDESRLAIDPAAYRNDVSLKGEFVRMVLASRMPQEEKERVLTCGIRALLGEGVQL